MSVDAEHTEKTSDTHAQKIDTTVGGISQLPMKASGEEDNDDAEMITQPDPESDPPEAAGADGGSVAADADAKEQHRKAREQEMQDLPQEEAARKIQKNTRKMQESKRKSELQATRPQPELGQQKLPSLELIHELFKLVDLNEDGVLDAQEMFRFVQCLDYPGDEAEWETEFKLLCEYHKWPTTPGIDYKGFVKIIDDPDDNYNCDSQTVVRVIGEFASLAPYEALDRGVPKDANSGLSAKRDPLSAITSMEVPVSFTVEGVDYSKLMARDTLREDFVGTIGILLVEHLGIQPEDIGEFLLSAGSVIVHTTIRTNSEEQARLVQQAVGGADTLREDLLEAIQSTPGIEDVINGPIGMSNISIGPAMPVTSTSNPMEVTLSPFASPGVGNVYSDEEDEPGGYFARKMQEQEYQVSPGGDASAAWTPMAYDFGSPSPSRLAFLEANRGGEGRMRRWPGRHQAGQVRSSLAEFKADMLKREQSLAGAWRNCLDPNWTGRVAIHEFCEACRAIGHRGNKNRLWRDLDVDGAGAITLNELAWDESELLGKFFGTLTVRYGGCRQAAKSWGMVGPKRFHLQEWMRLLTSNRLVNIKADADRLFRMLCSCPVGGGSAAFLGSLGPQLRDVAPAVTSREMMWLSKMGPGLPRPALQRVSPGFLGKDSPSTATGGPSLGPSPDFSSMNFSPTTLRGSPGFSPKVEPSPQVDSEFDLRSEGGSPGQENEPDIFATLYRQAMEHHKYRTELTEQKYVNYDSRRMNNQKLFERLYNHHKDRTKRHEDKVNEYMLQLKKEFNHGLVPKKHDSDSIARLVKPRKRHDKIGHQGEASCARQQRLWALLNTEDLMHECERLATELDKMQEQNEAEARERGEEYPKMRLDWKSKGKSREELIRFLEEADARMPIDRDKPTPEQSEKLFRDAERRQEHLEDQQRAAELAKEEQIKASFRCDLHGDKPHKTCRLCIRWAAMQSGDESPKKNGCKRLYEHAETKNGSKQTMHESHFKSLLHDGDRCGLIHGRDFLSAKVALLDQFKEDPRWECVRGAHRDKLIKEAIEEYTQKRDACEKEGKEWRKVTYANPEIYYRLHLDSYTKIAHKRDLEMKKAQEEEALIVATSVHRDVEGRQSIFHKLYRNDARERQAVPVESLQQLCNNEEHKEWRHYRWNEPVESCANCKKAVFSGYVSADESTLVCDDCLDTHHAVKRAAEQEDLIGKRVWVSWRETYWHRATVLDKNEEGSFHVVYEDDQKHEFVPRSRIKVPDNRHPQYEPGYKPRRAPGSPARISSPREQRRSRREPLDISSQEQNGARKEQNVLLFSFPEIEWPPPIHFESELRYNLESLGAPNMSKMKVRMRQMGVDRGVTAEISGPDDKIQAFQNARLDELQIMGNPVAEVWAQEVEEEPIADFADFVNLHFKSLKEAFKAFDRANSSTITYTEFLEVCKERGFDGNAKFVWHALNNGTSVVTYNDFRQLGPYISNKALITAKYTADKNDRKSQEQSLQPRNSQEQQLQARKSQEQPLQPLEDFARFIADLFPDLNTAWAHMEDSAGRDTLGLSDFLTACAGLNYGGDAKGAFRELDRAKKSSISRADFNLIGGAFVEARRSQGQGIGNLPPGHVDPGQMSSRASNNHFAPGQMNSPASASPRASKGAAFRSASNGSMKDPEAQRQVQKSSSTGALAQPKQASRTADLKAGFNQKFPSNQGKGKGKEKKATVSRGGVASSTNNVKKGAGKGNGATDANLQIPQGGKGAHASTIRQEMSASRGQLGRFLTADYLSPAQDDDISPTSRQEFPRNTVGFGMGPNSVSAMQQSLVPSVPGKMSLVQRARASALGLGLSASAGSIGQGGARTSRAALQDLPLSSGPNSARQPRLTMVKESPLPSTRASTAGMSRPSTARSSKMQKGAQAAPPPVNRDLRDFTETLLESYQDLDTAYSMIDLSGAGKISLPEFRAACKSMGFEGDANAVFQALDVYRTGIVGKRDFAQLLRYAQLLQGGEDEEDLKDMQGYLAGQSFAKPPNVARASLVVGLQG